VNGALALLLVLALLTPQARPRSGETLLQKLLRVAGLTAAPSQMRAPGDPEPGDVWIVSVEARAPRALTNEGGFRSPVFAPGDALVYALRSGVVVSIPIGGGPAAPQGRAPGVVKLVGFDGPDDLVVLTAAQPPASPVALFSLKSGQLVALPYDATSPEERRLVAFMRGDERVYGDTRVYSELVSREGALRPIESTDVFLVKGTAAPVNLSACGGINCSAPALSRDGRQVAFVQGSMTIRALLRATEYPFKDAPPAHGDRRHLPRCSAGSANHASARRVELRDRPVLRPAP
jgi:hypothetical protein